MNGIVPLPSSVRERLKQNTHPGLLLDKYVESWDPDAGAGKLSERVQRPALEAVVRLSQKAPAGFDLAALSARRNRLLEGLRASRFQGVTTGPLTLHLARASALENAGICLHPLYGFVYLPGSGLKGMTRAYAVLVWKPAQPDPAAAQTTIEAVFGNEPGEPQPTRQHAGAVVFHDAWPTQWPRLVLDILNNHHAKYYQGDDAPGDWENPVPVYFLAVQPQTIFEFALTRRNANDDVGCLRLAQEWLLGALCHFGAGAKTNSGYGAFKPVTGDRPALTSVKHATFEATLELVTPAFLAGANQQAADCELRPATLRGLLRWWWRTLHAGFVDVPTLRTLEAGIWGSAERGGAVQLFLEPAKSHDPKSYNKREHANLRPDQKVSDYGIPGADPGKTTQGLWYASFGMDERDKRRQYRDAGCTWTLRLVARGIGHTVSPQRVLDQAKAALWLLCHYGGVGSKARKGFGSLAANQLGVWNYESCQQAAAQLRSDLRLSAAHVDRLAESSSLGQRLPPIEVSFTWPNVWSVLDQIGFAYQAFSQQHKHELQKKALGLPHRIGSPTSGRFDATGPVKQLLDDARRNRRGEENVRHASPIHIHVAQVAGQYMVRVLAFPAAYLPDLATSRAFLQEFLDFFAADLKRRATLPPPAAMSGARPPSRAPGPAPQAHRPTTVQPLRRPDPSFPRAEDKVEAELLAEKTKKGGWRAKHVATGIVGPIQNSAIVPGDRQPGDKVTLIVAFATVREIAFRWPV
ncbi:MAG: type III-B CRISPR module RAMP protein Cmr6 [Planctomycetota bacterium]|nr:type III-B CRISPR module RAMP protein Cmr6 [Planctomycetota bacterium]